MTEYEETMQNEGICEICSVLSVCSDARPGTVFCSDYPVYNGRLK